MLLLTKGNLILDKQSHKKDALIACDTSYVKMVLKLITKVVVLHTMQASIIQIGVSNLKGFSLRCKVCLAIFLALEKQF